MHSDLYREIIWTKTLYFEYTSIFSVNKLTIRHLGTEMIANYRNFKNK